MKSLTEIQENYLAIDFFLSMSCNKDCHYCTSYTLEMRNLTVDMDFLRQTLGYLKEYKVRVVEIDCFDWTLNCTNLNALINLCKDYGCISISLRSNKMKDFRDLL